MTVGVGMVRVREEFEPLGVEWKKLEASLEGMLSTLLFVLEAGDASEGTSEPIGAMQSMPSKTNGQTSSKQEQR